MSWMAVCIAVSAGAIEQRTGSPAPSFRVSSVRGIMKVWRWESSLPTSPTFILGMHSTLPTSSTVPACMHSITYRGLPLRCLSGSFNFSLMAAGRTATHTTGVPSCILQLLGCKIICAVTIRAYWRAHPQAVAPSPQQGIYMMSIPVHIRTRIIWPHACDVE